MGDRENNFMDTLLKVAALLLFAVASSWAAWVSSATHTTSLRQEKVEGQLDTINYKLDMLLHAHELNSKRTE